MQIQKRMRKTQLKLSIAKSNEGLRITVISKNLINYCQKSLSLLRDFEDENKQFSSLEWKIYQALDFSTDLPNLTRMDIPNLSFLTSGIKINKNEYLAELILPNVFVDEEISEWLELFPKSVGMIKKFVRSNDLL